MPTARIAWYLSLAASVALLLNYHGCMHRDKLQETKLIQKLRKKSSGMQSEKLAVAGLPAERAPSEEREEQPDHVAQLMHSYVKATTVREYDEDEHMQKYVEVELAKRLGKRTAGEELDEAEIRRRKIEQDLYSIPKHLQTEQQDVPLGGLMTGIPEVTLPLEDRVKKIEETEDIKRRMLAAAGRRAHLHVEEERRPAPPAKMKRSALPIVFGKPEVRRCDRDQEELEGQRRRVVTETRPLTKGSGRGRGG